MKSAISLSLVLAMVMAGSALGVVTLGEDDLAPAPFRGEDGTTAQAWYFDQYTGTTGIAPDIVDSPGAPVVDMIGGFLDNTVYLPTDYDQQGVWIVDAGTAEQGDWERTSEMRIYLPNIEQQNDVKKIWLQVVYYAQEGKAPNVYVLPEGDDTQPVPKMEVVGDPTPLGDMYYHAVFELELPFNPFWEYVYIRPRDCQVYIDSVLLETQCIPEPLTFGLLGIGGLFLRRRR
mgnify:CR=1 FL=1